jgi:acylphosphatase
MRKRVQVFYAGRVQGVGFRYSAREVACGYDVTGFVRNLSDGRVEMVAEAEEDELKAFLTGIVESHLGSHIHTQDVTRRVQRF